MNYKQHEELLKIRQEEENIDIFKVANWALEYLPSGLMFLKKYYQDQLGLLANGYEIEGLSFLKQGISDWKKGLLIVSEGMSVTDKHEVRNGALLIKNSIRMLSYSHGDFSIDCDRLVDQKDELASYFALSSSYTYWIKSKFFY